MGDWIWNVFFPSASRCAALILASTAATAAPIAYTHSGTGSGSIAGLTFTDAAFTITSLADTSLVKPCEITDNCVFVNNNSSVIDIAGVGSFTFLTPTRTFSANNVVGFGVADTGRDLFNGPRSQELAGYDLISSTGPITGPLGNLVQWAVSRVETNHGILYFQDTAGNQYPATFSAVLSPVPESSTASTMVLGLACIAALSRMRRQS